MVRRVWIIVLTATLVPAVMAQGMEQNTDRPGLNYRHFDLDDPQPAHCQAACQEDGKCRAWTYVKPGVQGRLGRCWLKSGVPAARPDPCCISGVKAGAGHAGQAPVPMPAPAHIEGHPAPQQGTQAAAPVQNPPVMQWKHRPKMQIPKTLARHPVPPISRSTLVNRLLSEPRTAALLNQAASAAGMSAQQLTTRSLAGKAVGGGMPVVNPAGAMQYLNWEAGVRFTPRATNVVWYAEEAAFYQDRDYDYGLSGLYQRDELLVLMTQDRGVTLGVDMPPGTYVIAFEVGDISDASKLAYEYHETGGKAGALELLRTPQKSGPGQSSYSFIGALQVTAPGPTIHRFVLSDGDCVIIFRGITFTRL